MTQESSFTQEKADEICNLLAEGKSLRSVCEMDGMPAKSTVFKWLREIEGFSDQYARAKEESADALFEDLLDIADDGSNDWMQDNDPENPGYRVNGEALQRSKLRADVRKWALSKLKPKKYGDRIHTEHSGTVGLTDLSDEDLDRRLAELQQQRENAG